jgi:hypothetical protein
MRHREGELVGEGRGRVGAGAIGADPDGAGRAVVVAVRIGIGGSGLARGSLSLVDPVNRFHTWSSFRSRPEPVLTSVETRLE